jgi:GT2 family glycosyltransferase
MKLSIITINYNGSENTLELIKSLKNQTDKDFEVIVIDNASEEADFSALGESGGNNIFIIRNRENLGFSGGNNVGIKKAFETGSEWVILLNNDTWVKNDFIACLKPILSVREGIIGLAVDESGKTVNMGILEWLRPTLEHTYSQSDESRGRYINGAAMAISKGAFQKLGGFDEKYFLYFEDTDYSVRAKKAGINVSFLEEPEVHHLISATTKKLGSPMLLRYHYRNALYFNRKNGPFHIKLFVWFWSFWIIKKQIFKIMFRYKVEESHAILNGVFDFYKDRMGKIND